MKYWIVIFSSGNPPFCIASGTEDDAQQFLREMYAHDDEKFRIGDNIAFMSYSMDYVVVLYCRAIDLPYPHINVREEEVQYIGSQEDFLKILS